MNALCEKIIIFIFLFTAFIVLFSIMKKEKIIAEFMMRTKDNLTETANRRIVWKRAKLKEINSVENMWSMLEQNISYSGLKKLMPWLTAEVFFAGNICVLSVLAVFLGRLYGAVVVVIGCLSYLLMEMIIIRIGRRHNMKSVDNNLMKLLELLGSYSITEGELTSIFGQIGRYMDEPLRTVLEECCFEAQTTGDTGMALLMMAEKIEHPKFKELVRNMEVNIRHGADFQTLVAGSRRSVRDYLKSGQERRTMLREATINMVLLLIMAVASLFIVDGITADSIWSIAFGTIVGRVCVAAVIFIVLLFIGQILKN